LKDVRQYKTTLDLVFDVFFLVAWGFFWAENSGTVLGEDPKACQGWHLCMSPFLYFHLTDKYSLLSDPSYSPLPHQRQCQQKFAYPPKSIVMSLGISPLSSVALLLPPSAEIHLALLLTALESTQGVSHMNQPCRPTHAVIVGIVHTCNPNSRALLVWDANILCTEPNRTKESLDTSTRDALRQAQNNDRCPNSQTFWINKGQKRNHDNICLELTLKEILRIACEGLRIGKGKMVLFRRFQVLFRSMMTE
jgi:hypothetical protein